MTFYVFSKGSLVINYAAFLLGLFAVMAAPGLLALWLARGQSRWMRATAFVGPLIAMSMIISVLMLYPFFSDQGTSFYMPEQSQSGVNR